MDTVKFDKRDVKMTAHRGASGLETENTAAAFIAAGQRSYFGIETDIHKTCDGHFVCCHDSNIARVAGKSMVIEECTLEQLRSVCLLERGTNEERGYLRIPTLSEYISICKKYGKHSVAEIKGLMKKEDLAFIAGEFEALSWLENTTFIAFDFENLVLLRELLPNQKLQFLTGDTDDALIEKLTGYKMDIDIFYKSLTEDIVNKLHANGIEINCWTVDSKADGEKLAAWGVDHITSNILE